MKEMNFNKRTKIGRFLSSLPEGKVFFSNGQYRIYTDKGYISLAEFGYTVFYPNGHKDMDFYTKRDMIESLKKELGI